MGGLLLLLLIVLVVWAVARNRGQREAVRDLHRGRVALLERESGVSYERLQALVSELRRSPEVQPALAELEARIRNDPINGVFLSAKDEADLSERYPAAMVAVRREFERAGVRLSPPPEG